MTSSIDVPTDGSRPDIDRALVAALAGRDLSDAEWSRAETLLDLAWQAAVAAKPCAAAVLRPTWSAVLGELVATMLNNPRGYVSESEEAYSYTRAASAAAASVNSLTPEQVGRIWGGCPETGDVFTVHTGIRWWP